MNFIQAIIRVLQIVFTAIVLALSIVLAKGQNYGSPPSITSFNAFNGAFGLLVALIGMAGAFVEAIPSVVTLGADGLATLFYLAGSIAYAVQLGVHSCSSSDAPRGFPSDNWNPTGNVYTVQNSIINGGLTTCSSDDSPSGLCLGPGVDLQARCQEAQADTAFLFFALVCFIASLAVGLFSGGISMPRMGRNKGGSNSYV